MSSQEEREELSKLKGAKDAMAVALSLIDRLEATLKEQMSFTVNLRKTLGTDLHANFYRDGSYKILPIFSVIDEQIEIIKKQLN
jgi:hypothetical protein